jgi:hypothetical protein
MTDIHQRVTGPHFFAPLAQLVEASGLSPECCQFESDEGYFMVVCSDT